MASELAKNLRDEKQRAWHEGKEMLATATAEQRDFTPEEETRWNKINDHIDTLESRLKEVLEKEERSASTDKAFDEFTSRQQVRAPQAAGGQSDLQDTMRAFLDPDNRNARPVELSAAGSRVANKLSLRNMPPVGSTEYRVLMDGYVQSGGQNGSAVVPVDFYDQLLSYLIEVSGVMQTGPSVLNTQGGEPMNIPVVTQHSTATSAGQGTALPTSDPAFSQASLISQKFGIMIQVARELIDDTGINLLGYLAMQAGRATGNAVGTALINGSNGISGGVVGGSRAANSSVTGGVTTATGFNSITGSYGSAITGAPVYNDLVQLQYSVIAPYRQSKSCYWLMADATIGLLRRLRDVNGRPIWEPSAVLGSPDLLLGKPLVADPFMPAVGAGATSIAFGDFSQYFVRLVGGVRFERSDDYAFGSDLVSFRALVRADGTFADYGVPAANRAVKLFQGGAS